jgi:teichuronic acid biosynthesis protein TuaE
MTARTGGLDPKFPRWPLVAGAAALTVLGAILAVLSPKAAIALVVVVGLVTFVARISDRPIARLMVPFVGTTVVAAILGPNLAIPQAPGAFLFRILIVALVLGAVGYMLMGGRLRFPAALSIPAALLAAMIAWATMSIAWSQNTGAAVRWTAFLAMMVVLAVAMPMVFTTRQRVTTMLKVLGLTFAAVTGFAFVEIATGYHLPTSRLTQMVGGSAFAATSVFGNQNNFATFLTLALPYLVTLPLIFRQRRMLLIGIAGTVLDLAALLLTGSKDNLLAAGLVFLTLLLFLATDPKQRSKLVGAVVIAIVAIIVVVPSLNGSGLIPLPQRAVNKFSFSLLEKEIASGQGSGAARASLLGDGITFVGQTGGIGVGAGNAETHVLELADFPGVSNLHDWWLEMVVDLGLIGLALYVTYYLLLLTRQLRWARRSADPLVRYLCLAGSAAMVGFVLGSLAPSTMIAFSPMWVMFGLSMTAIAIAERARRHGGYLP